MHTHETLARLLAASQDLTDEGMLNLQKLIEALTFATVRVEARSYRSEAPADARIREVKALVADLPETTVPQPVRALVDRALDHYSEGASGDLPYDIAPDLFVCRNCGHIATEIVPVLCPSCGESEGVFRRFQGMFNGDNAEPTDPRSLVDLLDENARTLQATVAGLSQSVLKRSPFPGRWSLHDHILHFHQAQCVLVDRISLMLSEDSPRLDTAVPYQLDSAIEEELNGTQRVLETYLTERRTLTGRLRGLSIAELWRTGRHGDFGIVSVMHQIKYFAHHEQAHFGTIAAVRKAVAR